MPRPTPAQLAYGTATVVCATLAMLLLSQARSLPALLAVAGTALALGLLVALAFPLARPRPRPRYGRRPGPPPAAAHPAERRHAPHVSAHR